MAQSPVKRFIYRTETDSVALLRQINAIRALADSEKEALGFLPEAAYRDAIMQRRLIAMLASENGASHVAGFVLFSGVFPNARIQAVVVRPDHRRNGIASALVSALVSDLVSAQAFYESRGFVAKRVRDGGQARHRTIVLRSRDLDTANFFTLLKPPAVSGQETVNLGLRPRSAFEAPLYVIDLNVLFDLMKQRARSAIANRLFGAGLAHQVRLAVAPEFIAELERTSNDTSSDTTLKLARQLPKLPTFPKHEVDELAATIHKAIFIDTKHPQAGSRQALSDARHLAEAALIRASGYITSDNALLDARDALLMLIGVDVAGLDEFVELLPSGELNREHSRLKGTNCETKSATPGDAQAYLATQNISIALIAEHFPTTTLQRVNVQAILDDGEIVAVAIHRGPASVDAPGRMLVQYGRIISPLRRWPNICLTKPYGNRATLDRLQSS